MKKFYSLCALCALLLIPNIGKADVLFSESFDEMTNGRLSKGAWSSGTLPSDGWYTNGGPSTFRQVVAQQLTYSGYCSSASGKAVESLKGQQKDYILFPAAKQHATISSGEKYYMSFLYKATELNTSSTALAGTNTYIAGLLMSTSGTGIAFTNAQVMATPINASTYKLGIRKITETAQYAEAVLNINTTYLIVAEYIVNSGSADDVVNLYINPSKDSKTVAATNTQVSAPTDKTSIVGVGILGISNAPTSAIVDELKVTTSWDDLWESGSTPDPDPDPEPEPIAQPEPAASAITVNSATISWEAVTDADSYVLQWKKSSAASYGSSIEIDKDVRSYDLFDLVENTAYTARVKTVVGENASEWAEVEFTTEAEPGSITYESIKFLKYSTTNDLPSFGNWFVARDIILTTDVNITGDLKLCLNGDSIYTGLHRIVVKNGGSLTLYNYHGEGAIIGGVVAPSWGDLGGVIKVEEGGTLIIREGEVKNIAEKDDGSYAINNLGTLKISGAPLLIGESASIYLGLGKKITLESGKPLTNTTENKYSVDAFEQLFTSGWSECMGDATPSNHFASAKSSFSQVRKGRNELYLVHAATISLSENSNNASAISGAVGGGTDDVLIDRAFTDAQYNTICLPFALSNDKLEAIFGYGYDLEEFVSSSMEGDVLSLNFASRSALEAGKPYLIKPSQPVEDILRNGIDITEEEPVDNTSDANISFHGTFSPTELTGGNKNLLFLGAGNELFWPEATGNLKGFRAYFEVKGDARKAVRARISKKEEHTTDIGDVRSENANAVRSEKIFQNGQILIKRDGKTYNVLGSQIR